MRLTLCAVGRAKAGPERDLFDHYARRLTWPFELREVDERKPLVGAVLKRREADLLRAQIPKKSTIVVLDERGRNLTSPEFAMRLGRWQDDGIRETTFVIGGADGIDGDLRLQADLMLSLGKFTWPHMLVRGLLVEQIYRAQCILVGHPYHRP